MTNLLHSSAELFSLMYQHPTYSILYLFGEEGKYEGDRIAEHARYSLSRVVTYHGTTYTKYDTLVETITGELWKADFSEFADEIDYEAGRRAKAVWERGVPIILVEVW